MTSHSTQQTVGIFFNYDIFSYLAGLIFTAAGIIGVVVSVQDAVAELSMFPTKPTRGEISNLIGSVVAVALTLCLMLCGVFIAILKKEVLYDSAACRLSIRWGKPKVLLVKEYAKGDWHSFRVTPRSIVYGKNRVSTHPEAWLLQGETKKGKQITLGMFQEKADAEAWKKLLSYVMQAYGYTYTIGLFDTNAETLSADARQLYEKLKVAAYRFSAAGAGAHDYSAYDTAAYYPPGILYEGLIELDQLVPKSQQKKIPQLLAELQQYKCLEVKLNYS